MTKPTTTTTTMAPPPLRIGIIGAGPGGTCLARILTQQLPASSLSLTIFEGEASLNIRSQGGTLDLRQDSGLEAMRAANLMDVFDKYARYDGESLVVCDKHFQKWMVQVGDKEDRNARAPEIDRFRLRQILLEALPEGVISWGKKVVRVVEEGEGKQGLEFKDGSREGGFDLVVGAEGTWSKVRPMVSEAKPGFAGVVGWAFTIAEAREVCPETIGLLKGGNLMSLHDRLFLSMQTMGDGVLQLTLFFLQEDGEKWMEKADYDTTDVEAVRDWILREKMATWHPQLREPLEKLSRQNTKHHPWTLWELPVGHRWEHRRGVTLMGDSAHVMTPFAGEGANQALVDATVLAKEIVRAVEKGKGGGEGELAEALDDAVKEYEKEMFARMAEKMANTEKMKHITMKEGGLYQNAETWIIGAVEDGLPMAWLTRPLVAALVKTYFFFWRMWNRPKP